MTRICFLIPYFGRWPFWMPYFIESCRANPSIQWILYTDCGPIPGCPQNVEIRPTSFADYCTLVEKKLEIRFAPTSPYKLCDLKPAFGYLHAEDIQGFDFWGFSDIDLVYGQLREYFTESRLARHHLFSTHERRVSGHLCLIRNDEKWNNLFRQVENWKASFSTIEHEAFDEDAFTRLFIKRKNWPSGLRKHLDALNPLRRDAEFVEAYSTPYGRVPWINGKKKFPATWFWQQGILTNDMDAQRTFPYFHFIGLKGLWPHLMAQSEIPSWDTGSAWKIDRDGFAPLTT